MWNVFACDIARATVRVVDGLLKRDPLACQRTFDIRRQLLVRGDLEDFLNRMVHHRLPRLSIPGERSVVYESKDTFSIEESDICGNRIRDQPHLGFALMKRQRSFLNPQRNVACTRPDIEDEKGENTRQKNEESGRT